MRTSVFFIKLYFISLYGVACSSGDGKRSYFQHWALNVAGVVRYGFWLSDANGAPENCHAILTCAHTHTQLLTATRMGTKIYAWLNLSVTLDVFWNEGGHSRVRFLYELHVTWVTFVCPWTNGRKHCRLRNPCFCWYSPEPPNTSYIDIVMYILVNIFHLPFFFYFTPSLTRFQSFFPQSTCSTVCWDLAKGVFCYRHYYLLYWQFIEVKLL